MTIPDAHYRISIKGVCRNTEGKVLMTLKKGRWDLPGGGIDHGEDFTQALIREVKEEMGIKVTYVDKMPHYVMTRCTKGGRYISNFMIYMDLADIDFTPSEECEEIGFFSYNEIVSMGELPYSHIVDWARYVLENNPQPILDKQMI